MLSIIRIKNTGAVNRSGNHSIMANSGFGAMTIYRKDGAVIEVPQTMINSQGFIKSGLYKDLQEITREKAESLEKRGVKLFIGKAD